MYTADRFADIESNSLCRCEHIGFCVRDIDRKPYLLFSAVQQLIAPREGLWGMVSRPRSI